MQRRVVLITGASSGIGAATAIRIAESCDGLILQARKSVESLERVAETVRKKGVRTALVIGDLGDDTLAKRLVDAGRDAFGRLDAVVANAGFPILKSFDEGGPADLEHAFKGNVASFFALAREAASLLAQSPCGRIVAVGSFTAHVFRTDLAQFPMSAASKGALEVAVRSLAQHLAQYGVTVNCVVPGAIEKDPGKGDVMSDEKLAEYRARIPLGRLGKPNDVAAAIEFLISPDAAYITGQALHINGGLI